MRHGSIFSLFVVVCGLLSSCSEISNNINDISNACEISSSEISPTEQYLQFVSKADSHESSVIDGINPANGESLPISPGGCLTVNKLLEHQVVLIKKKSTQEGLLINTRDFADNLPRVRLIQLSLEKFNYKPVTSSCNAPISLSNSDFQFPLQTEVPLHAYKIDLKFLNHKNQTVAWQDTWMSTKHLNQLQVQTSTFEEGKYSVKVQLKELFSFAEAEFSFDCEIILDRTASNIVFERFNREIINKNDDSFLAFQPGEVLKLGIFDDLLSETTIYSCLLPHQSSETECTYHPLSDRTFTVPSFGKWALYLYTQDSSGNKSKIEYINFVAFNQAVVNEILSIINSAELLRSSGKKLQALSKAFWAYQKYVFLKTDLEREVLDSKIQKLIYEGVNGLFLTDEVQADYLKNGDSFLGWLDSSTYIQRHTYAEVDQLIIKNIINRKQDRVVNLHNLIKDSHTFFVEVCDKSDRYLLLSKSGSVGRLDVHSSELVFQNLESKSVNDTYSTSNCDRIVIDLQDLDDGLPYTAIWEPEKEKFDFMQKKKLIPLLVNGETHLVELDEDANNISNFDSKVLLLENVREIEAVSPCSNQLVIRTLNDTSIVYDSLFRKKFVLPNKKNRVVFSASCETISYANNFDYFDTYSLLDGRKIGSGISKVPVFAKSVSVGRNYIAAISEGQANEVLIWSIDGKHRESLHVRQGGFKYLELNDQDMITIASSNRYEIYEVNNSFLNPVRSFSGAINGLAALSKSQFLYKTYILDQSNFPEFQVREQMILIDRETNLSIKIELPVAYTYDARPVPSQVMHANTINVQKTIAGKQKIGVVVNRGSVRIYNDASFKDFVDYPVSNGWLLDLDLHSDGSSFIAAGRDGNVYMHNGKETFQFFAIPACKDNETVGTEYYPVHVKFIEALDRIIVSDNCGKLHRFDRISYHLEVGYLSDRRPDRSVSAHLGDARITLNSTGKLFASVGYGGKAKFWSPELELLDEIDLQKGSSTDSRGLAIRFDEYSKNLLIGSYDGSWSRYDLQNKKLLKIQFAQPSFGAKFLDIFPGDPTGLLTSDGNEVLIWDLDIERFTRKICDFLTPRQHLLGDITAEEREACQALFP